MSGATDSGMVKTMGVVAGALVVLGIIITIAARALSSGVEDPDDPLMRNALIKRIQPVAAVRTSAEELPAATVVAVAAGPRSAEELVNGVCAACHAAGVAGAPMVGDAAAWAPRVEQGLDTLVSHAINGIGTMPARGGSDYSDEEMRLAVQLMAGLEVDEVEPAADAEAPAAEEAPAEAPAADATEEAPAEEAPTEEAPAEEAPAQDEASAEEAPAEEESGAAGALVVGQVPDGLTDNIQSNVDALCISCHMAGVGGAPKVGDQAAWQERADKGLDVLTASVINGLGAMPPRGASSLTDEEIPVAIQYLMSK